MKKFINKVKLALLVVCKDDTVVIHKNGESLEVSTGCNSKQDIQDVATKFFRAAYLQV